MARLRDATWHLKSVTLGMKGRAHIEPHGWHDSMAHIKPCSDDVIKRIKK